MLLSTKKIICILGGLVSLELAIGTGQLKVTEHMIPASMIDAVKDWAAFLAFVGTTIISVVSGGSWYADSGDSAPASAPKASSASVVAILALGIGLMLAFSGGVAEAQTRPAPQFTGDLIKDVKANNAAGLGVLTPQQLLTGLAQVNLKQLQYAKAQAKAAGNSVTLPCWSAWVDLISKAQQPLKDDTGADMPKPDPNLFGDIESASELLQSLQVGGAIQVGCGAMLDASKKSVMQMITSVVSGNGLVGLLPIPPIP